MFYKKQLQRIETDASFVALYCQQALLYMTDPKYTDPKNPQKIPSYIISNLRLAKELSKQIEKTMHDAMTAYETKETP